LIELATSSGRSEHTSRLALVEAEQNPADIIASAREAAAVGEHEDARAMYELARALGVELSDGDEAYLENNPPRLMAADEAYAAALDERERRALVDDRGAGALGEILELLGEAAHLIFPDPKIALDTEALSDARRISMSDAPAVKMYPQIAKALGGPPTLLYGSASGPHKGDPRPEVGSRLRTRLDPLASGPELRVLVSSPPVVVIGPRLAELDSVAKLRFQLGRIVELTRPHRLLANDPNQLGVVVAALWHALGKPEIERPRNIAREAERLHHALPMLLRRRIAERLATLTPEALDPETFVAASARAADRAGLLACGHVGIALQLTSNAEHLVQLAASQKYLAARRKLRRRVTLGA
jgi:hypothetical protein